MLEFISASSLIQTVRARFATLEDHRAANKTISLSDALMSGFAMFSLKDSSLLEFDQRRQAKDENLKAVYGIEHIPCDTHLRTILDSVEPAGLRPIFKDILRLVERNHFLTQMVFMNKYYLLSLDGSGYYGSSKVHCASCLQKQHKNGETTYAHQLLAAAIVHPDQAVVIPLAPEPIVKQDGDTKNDCERNAAKRFLAHLRQDYPNLPLIITEDALSANAPHIQALQTYQLHYILGVKEGDHAFLFDYVEKAHQAGQTTVYEQPGRGVIHRYRFINQAPLNAAHPDLRVNFIEYWEISPTQTQHFCKITDFTVTKFNVLELMRGGRTRWKIENETLNTLKNQDYHLEHNYGHGHQHLSLVLVGLMMAAFLVDQVQQLASSLFQAVLKKEGSRKRLWTHLRALFYTLPFSSLDDILRALLYGYQIKGLNILGPT
jgi:hypothetical protein